MLSKAAYRHLSRMTSLAELASFLKANAPKTRKSVKLRKQRMLSKKVIQGREMAFLRADVFERAEWLCELCEKAEAVELHHLEGGSGRRRQMQAVENCMAVCMPCHRYYHHRPDNCRARVEEWAAEYGYPMPSRFSIAERDDHDIEPPDQQERE